MAGTYNGFSGAQRAAAAAWFKALARKPTPEPLACDGCGTSSVPIARHSEDYSAPYGAHVGRWGVCYTCHMMVHCRYKSPHAWERYRELVREGSRVVPARNWYEFRAWYLQTPPEEWVYALDAESPVEETWLDQVEAGAWFPDPDRE